MTDGKRRLADFVPDSASEDGQDDDEGFQIQPGPSLARDDEIVCIGVRGGRPAPGSGRAGSMFTVQSSAAAGPSRLARGAGQQTAPSKETYWNVQWRKPQARKHKTWDSDAVLVVRQNACRMIDMDGKDVATATLQVWPVAEGLEFKIGGREVIIDSEIPAQQFLDGTCFGHGSANQPKASTSALTRPFKPPIPRPGFNPPVQGGFKHDIPIPAPAPQPLKGTAQPIPASSFFGARAPARPIGIGAFGKKKRTEPRFDPLAEGAVVMKRPSREAAAKLDTEILDVVVDPYLSKSLREHQKEGVKFMYECVMGLRKMEATGCILADEMGLGKTLQTIALVYTLLKQSPFASQQSVIGKCIIVCPVSLVQNWKKEFYKWLGRDRLGIFVGDGDKAKIKQFVNSKNHQVLLIGYEKLRTVIGELASATPKIDLIVCDEGHRLKSKDNKTTKMFDALSTKRRIILSGTPLQNDLGEYWAMADFACPGLLDTYSVFNKLYERPIVKSRSPGCSEKDMELGRARADKLGEIASQFVIRRTADLLKNYLPPKREYVLFIAPTTLQLDLFAKLLTPAVVQSFVKGATTQALALISHLRKVCNSPVLLRKTDGTTAEVGSLIEKALELVPRTLQANDVTISGKLIALDQLLHSLHRTTDEKVVIVSNYTSTLNLLEEHCRLKRYRCLRLDGQTAQKNRQTLVDAFNRGTKSDSFAFLLSSKAGGTGLNLIGASRLILFDSDWNPSTDLQAMARIHRDGQKRTVHIYRFLTTGTIDEKIFQRQVTKMGLSDQLMNARGKGKKDGTDSFTAEELRDLFTIPAKTSGCQTHDLLGCDCISKLSNVSDSNPEDSGVFSDDDDGSDDQQGFVQASQYRGEPPAKRRKAQEKQQAKLAALHQWAHVDPSIPSSMNSLSDDLLLALLAKAANKHDQSGDVSVETSVLGDEEDFAILDEPETETLLDDDQDEKDDILSFLNGINFEAEMDIKPEPELDLDLASDFPMSPPPELKTGVQPTGKFDLRQMAASGQAGRIMFVFEKTAQSELL